MIHISNRVRAAMLGVTAIALMAVPAQAITADLAKKCREMAIKAHPTMPAGSPSGYAAAQRGFFNECVAKNGDMAEAKPSETTGSAPTGSAPSK
jgi:hypothetical protein